MAKYYSESVKKAVARYQKTHIQQVKFNFSIEHDADILAKLETVGNKQGYIKDLIRADIARNLAEEPKKEESKMKHMVQFESGEGRDIQGAVNYLICPDIPELYAEIAVPDGASDDYGYLTLKARILGQAEDAGISAETLTFWYDGQEDKLAEDASTEI